LPYRRRGDGIARDAIQRKTIMRGYIVAIGLIIGLMTLWAALASMTA
jgi:hypothetical protein